MASPHADHWALDPAVTYLNHGSFGACPRRVLEVQHDLRTELEREPVDFMIRALPRRLDAARERLAVFLGAEPSNLVPVANASTGVNSVLRSLRFEAGDELLVTDHEYNASRNALDFVAGHSGARVVVAPLPFPLTDAGEAAAALLERVTERTRLVMVDHVTSQTGLVLPLASIVDELAAREVPVLVDGAHGPGMLPLRLEALGATYYTGNCHKWLCSPKGAGFLWVGPGAQQEIRPLVISHGANSSRPGRSRFHDEFDWVGTDDPTPFLSVPAALDTLGSLLPGGWPELRRRNRALALEGRRILCDTLGIEPPAPDGMIGSLAALPLPDDRSPRNDSPLELDPLQDALYHEDRIEVMILPWPAPPRRVLRVSAQLYNDVDDYRRLGEALSRRLG